MTAGRPAQSDAEPVRRLASAEQRIPEDRDTEALLLGAVLLRPAEAWPNAVELTGADFYWPSYGHIHAAMAAVVADGEAVHPTTVTDRLRRMGLLEQVTAHDDKLVTGAAVLIHLEGAAGVWPSRAGDYAAVLRRLGQARRLAEQFIRGLDAARLGDLEAIVPVLEEAEAALDQVQAAASSWNPVDVGAALQDGITPLVPTLAVRDDGEALLYEGRTHSFNAEPEAGKTFLALVSCAGEIRGGRDALYLDFEADVGSVLERLLALGVTPEDAAAHFVYVRPDDPLDLAARLRVASLVAERAFSLAVIDGVAEAMALGGWSENENAEVAAFFRALPRAIERTGAAVVLIDHVVKDRQSQGRYARGGGHKLAGLSGAAYRLDVVRPFGRGQTGVVRVTVVKDRPGWVRRLARPGGVVAELELASSDDGETVVATLRAPAGAGSDEFRPTGYMERVSRALEDLSEPASLNQLRRLVSGKNTVKDAALACLVDEGYVAREPGRRGSLQHRSIRPYRESDDQPADESAESDDADF